MNNILIIIFIILIAFNWALLLFAGDEIDNKILYKRWVLILYGVSVIIIPILSTIISETNQEKRTAIKCLKGYNPYEMKILYQLKDSTLIAYDTLYIKIQK